MAHGSVIPWEAKSGSVGKVGTNGSGTSLEDMRGESGRGAKRRTVLIMFDIMLKSFTEMPQILKNETQLM